MKARGALMKDSFITKKAISDALIELCHYKRFDKISIADITDKCRLNRQTLYYHFSDKYDLLEWTYQIGAFSYLAEGVTLENWEEHVLKMLIEIKEKADFYQNTVSSDSEILSACFSKVTSTLFMELFERLDLEDHVSQADRCFYARFFSYGCCGVLVDWIKVGMKETPDTIATQFVRLANDTELLAYQRLHEG